MSNKSYELKGENQMTERIDEILKKSSFNQHTDEFLIKLEDMNEITKIVEELEEENEQLKDDINRMSNEYLHCVKQQNKRYREVLEEIKKVIE